MSPKGTPLQFFFHTLQQTGVCPLFSILKTLRFLSLRYSADFDRFEACSTIFFTKFSALSNSQLLGETTFIGIKRKSVTI